MTEENKMQSLYKGLDFQHRNQYFDYCIESLINGQRTQAKQLFKDLPKVYKHELITYLRDTYANDEAHNFFISLF
jgi:nucleoid-associated protein YejK